MDTSLAPSPIANVMPLRPSLMRPTISAFCNGLTRQQTTARQCLEMWIRSSRLCGSLRAYSRACPSITSAYPPGRNPFSSPTSEPALIILRTSPPAASIETGGGGCFMSLTSIPPKKRSIAFSSCVKAEFIEPYSPPRTIMRFMSGARSIVLYPIAMAVSSLSPVATQIFIPARFRSAIVSGTPS